MLILCPLATRAPGVSAARQGIKTHLTEMLSDQGNQQGSLLKKMLGLKHGAEKLGEKVLKPAELWEGDQAGCKAVGSLQRSHWVVLSGS